MHRRSKSMNECTNVTSKIWEQGVAFFGGLKPLQHEGSKHRVQILLPQSRAPGLFYPPPSPSTGREDRTARPTHNPTQPRPDGPAPPAPLSEGLDVESPLALGPALIRQLRVLGGEIRLQEKLPRGGAERAQERLKQGLCGVSQTAAPSPQGSPRGSRDPSLASPPSCVPSQFPLVSPCRPRHSPLSPVCVSQSW